MRTFHLRKWYLFNVNFFCEQIKAHSSRKSQGPSHTFSLSENLHQTEYFGVYNRLLKKSRRADFSMFPEKNAFYSKVIDRNAIFLVSGRLEVISSGGTDHNLPGVLVVRIWCL